jgi:hypothetical protein
MLELQSYMKNPKSFKEYLESKELLKLALDEAPKVREIYEIEKYCSVPIVEADGEKEYLKFKPKDLIEILWENTSDTPTPKYFTVLTEGEDPKTFAWSNAKIKSWIKKMTRQL